MLSDPVLETRWTCELFRPNVNQQDNTVYYSVMDFQEYGKYIVNGGSVPLQSVCQSTVHTMGGVVLQDEEVYKVVEPWTALNYNPATKNACGGCGTSPALH